VLLVTLGFGAIGFYDDYLKVSKQSHKGFSGKARLGIEFVIAGIAVLHDARRARVGPAGSTFGRRCLPVPQGRHVNLGWFFVLFGAFVIVGAGNAVNLTDGLDGLAIVPVMIASASFGMIAYLAGNAVFSELPADQLRAGHRRTRRALRRGARGGARLPLVQRAAGLDLHGRHRFAGAGRHARLHRRRHQARDRARHHRRPVRAGSRCRSSSRSPRSSSPASACS
jgi:hypothetical protein